MYTFRKFTLFQTCIILLIIVSCKKSSSGGGTPAILSGNWTFVSMQGQTSSAITESVAGNSSEALTTSNYTTTKNAGTITFGADSMGVTGLTYSISDSATTSTYLNGIFQDSVKNPYTFSIPAVNSGAKYQLIGTDSLYFPSGGAFLPGGLSSSLGSAASGATFVVNGNTMTLTTRVSQTTSQTAGGIATSDIEQGTYVITLSKN